jgi:hypothetical protein
VGCEKDGYRFGMCIDCLNEIRDIQKAKGHDYRNGACVRCGDAVPEDDAESFASCAKYELNADEKGYILVNAGKFSGKTAVIPDEYEGLPVVEIGEWAFYNTDGVEEVIVPDSVKLVGEGAFASCEELERVTLGKSVVSLGKRAFEKCINLREASLPDALEEIGAYCFSGCENLLSVRADGGVSIGAYAFKNCEKLHSFSFPETLDSIGEGAFEASGITSAHLPESVTKIGKGAFASSALQSVTVPGNIIGVTPYIFSECNALKTATVKTSLIRSEFSGCKNLETIVFCEGVEYIMFNSVDRCGVKTVYLPKSLKSLGDPFMNCDELESIVYAGTAEEFLAVECIRDMFAMHSGIKVACTDKVLVKSDLGK